MVKLEWVLWRISETISFLLIDLDNLIRRKLERKKSD